MVKKSMLIRGQSTLGAWVAELISENDPVGATLCQKFSSNGQNTFEWEAGVIIDLAREKLGITFEW